MPGDSRTEPTERRPGGDVGRGAPPRGAGTLTAILPNGRIVWLRADPRPAPAVAVAHLAQLAEDSTRWRRAATRSQNDALGRLSQALAADGERLSEAGLDRARRIRRRIVSGDNRLDRRLAKAAEDFRARLDKQMEVERTAVRRLGRRDLWDSIVIASALPLFAAYGQPGRPFGPNHLALTLSLLIWLVGDEVVDALFGSRDRSPYPLRDTDAWSYLAPIGNVLAGWWLLDGLQHERFVAGAGGSFQLASEPEVTPAELVYRYEARVELRRLVAPRHFPDFETFAGVPAVATVRALTWSPEGLKANARLGGLSARVDRGTLILTFTALADLPPPATDPPPSVLGALEAAWVVDTAEPEAAGSPA